MTVVLVVGIVGLAEYVTTYNTQSIQKRQTSKWPSTSNTQTVASAKNPEQEKNIAYDYLTPVCAKIKPVEQNS